MYDMITGVNETPVRVLTEGFSKGDELLVEGIVSNLGDERNPTVVNIARRIIGFVNREIPNCGDNPACLKGLDNKARYIIKDIERLRHPMVMRILNQYQDVSNTSKVKVLYKLLVT